MPDAPDPLAAELAAIREREQQATPGPWYSEPNTGAGRVWVQIGRRHFADADCEPLFNVRYLGTPATDEQQRREYVQREADAAFIVTARSAMPHLIAALEAVLRDHEPRTRIPPNRHYAICRACSRIWPCATVQAITSKLLSEEGT